jgi:tRNA dimethylallyltransferase
MSIKNKKISNGVKNKLVVILGPTSSGKTDLSIKIAKKFNGNVVSADSRQVYKGMNIGTGKITKKEMASIKHYLLDVASPNSIFTVSQFKKLGEKAIQEIIKKNKLPLLVGGTGFYIQAITDGVVLPEIKPDWKLRKKLEKQPVSELFSRLQILDPVRAKTIDKNNPRRLIRALEIVLKSKRPIPPLTAQNSPYDALFIGIKKDKTVLKKLIKTRLIKRLNQGMVNEVKRLHKSGVSFRRLEEFGLEYRYLALYLQGKLSYEDMFERLNKEIEHYAKRQMTWFKRNKKIHWIADYKQAEKLVKKFMPAP